MSRQQLDKPDPKLKDPIHAELMKIPEIRSLTEVTGRFDMIVNISAHIGGTT